MVQASQLASSRLGVRHASAPSISPITPSAGGAGSEPRPRSPSPDPLAELGFAEPETLEKDAAKAAAIAAEPDAQAHAEAEAASAASIGEQRVTEVADVHGNLPSTLARLKRTLAVLQDGIEKNLHTGVQLSVRLAGDVQLDVAVGECRAERPMDTELLANWMSTSKVVAVIAIFQLIEQGKLATSDYVCKHLPAFGRYGKELITVENLLVHTAGIPYADVSMWSAMHDTEKVLATIYESKIEDGWQPGSRAAYHPYSSWFLLGEVVRVLDGRRFERYVREQIFLPLGMDDCYIGMDEATFQRYHGHGRFCELRTMSAKGKVLPKATVGTTPNEVKATVPGSNGRGPAKQWLHLFECLVNEGRGPPTEANPCGARLLQEATVARLTKRHRIGMFDVIQGVQCDWTLGLFVGSSLTGEHSSPETYGHGGSQSSMGFCDPVHKLAMCVACNTRPGPKHHYERMARISTALYEDLGIAVEGSSQKGGSGGGSGSSGVGGGG